MKVSFFSLSGSKDVLLLFTVSAALKGATLNTCGYNRNNRKAIFFASDVQRFDLPSSESEDLLLT